MLVKCPYCFLEKEISAIQPGKKYKITCPQCGTVFHLPIESSVKKSLEKKENPATEDPSNITEEINSTPSLHERETYTEDLNTEISRQSGSADEKQERGKSLMDLFNRLEKEKPISEDTATNQERRHKSDIPSGAPWEHPDYYGLGASFLYTFVASIFHPATFFKNLVGGVPQLRPIVYYILMTLVQVVFGYFWSTIKLSQISSTSTDQNIISLSENMANAINLPMILLITPFLAVFLIFIISGFYYLMVRLVQPEKADFTIILRVLCYSSSIYIFFIIPSIGAYIATFGYKILIFLGCKWALKLSWKNTAFAILPIFILEILLKTQLLSFITGA